MGEAGRSTVAVTAGLGQWASQRDSLVLPVYQSSVFGQGYDDAGYARRSQPNRVAFEQAVSRLEAARHGYAYPSGMAAIFAAISAVDPRRCVLPRDVYGGLYELLARDPRRERITFDFADVDDPVALDRVLDESTLLWLESPSNPYLGVHDIMTVARRAHEHGATVVVDNTLATPCAQTPLALGADVVVHSATKFIGGHSDAVGGLALTSDDGLAERLRYFQQSAGLILAPQESWLLTRGLRTLPVRLAAQAATAERLVDVLRSCPTVTSVHYPAEDETARLLHEQGVLRSFGAVVAFTVAEHVDPLEVMARLRLFHVAMSLGGVESTVSHPATMSHRVLVHDGVGAVSPQLLRLSVGLEESSALEADLRAVLAG